MTGEPLRDLVAAVSVGIVDGAPVLDLDYAEDSGCDTDMNVVMTGGGGFVELQGTAEGAPFSRARDGGAGARSREGGIARARRGAAGGAAHVDLAASSWRPATRASCASSAGCWRRSASTSSRRRSSASREADEPHATFVENALAKARHASALARAARARRRFRRLRRRARRRAGRAVGALRGRTDVRRAQQREAGRRAARASPTGARITTACSCWSATPDDPEPLIAEGAGTARSSTRRAASGGFGYDPHFQDDATGLTGAELPLERKNELSHRGQAMRALLAQARRDDGRGA